MECVAYLRVSTEKQAEEGNGLDSQKRDITVYASKNEMVIKEWYIDDGYTGSNMNRPALQRLIADCYAKKIKNIIAFKLDRLSRSMIDGLYIIEKIFIPNGVNFKCVHDTVSYDSPMEQAYTQMMAVFAQLDKNTMLLRMRGGMLERIKQGYWKGGGTVPWCYNYDTEKGILVPNEERAEIARQSLELFISGWTDRKIKDFFGYSCESLVRKVLMSEVNIGMIPYKGELYQGLHEPIFDRERYELGLRVRKSRRDNKAFEHNASMLTGLCYCGVCGCAMRYQKWTHGKHKIYCYSRNKHMTHLPNYNPECTNGLYWADEIEKQVEEKILQISLTLTPEDMVKPKSNIEVLQKQLEGIKSKLKRLYGVYAEGNDTVVEVIGELEKESDAIKAKIQEEEKSETKTEKKIRYEEIKKIADVWQNIDKKNKNLVLKSIIDKVVIVNGDIEIRLK